MNMQELERLIQRLEEAGRLTEVLDKNGKIQPSESALQQFHRTNVDEGEAEQAEQWRLAQAQTILDLAQKYRISLN